MAELRSLLAFMDPEDRARALSRYEQLFDRAGEEGEEELLRQLGSPIRQVLEVEQEYRKARKEGKIIYSEELPNQVPDTAEMIPARDEEAPSDLGQTVREAAAELERFSRPEKGPEETAEEPADEDIFTMACVYPSDMSFAADDPDNAAAAPLPEQLPTPPQSASGGLFEDGWDKVDEEDENSEIVRIMEFAAKAAPAKETEAEPEEAGEKPGAGRVFAAVLVTVPLIVLWVLGLALSLTLGAAMMAVGFACCAAGVYLAGYAVGGYIAFMPDLLLVCGGALGCFALALFFLWLGLWFAVGGVVALARVTGRTYRKILKKKAQEEEDDE